MLTTLLIIAIVIGVILVLIGINSNKPGEYKPDEGYLEAKWKAKAATVHTEHITANTALVNAQTANADAHHVQQNLPNRWALQDLESRSLEESLKLQIANSISEQKLLPIAEAYNITTEELREVSKGLLLKKGEIELQRLANEIDQEKSWRAFQHQIEAAIKSKLLIGVTEAKSLQAEIDGLVRDIHEIEASKEPGWEEIVKDRRLTLQSLRRQKRERESPVQGNSRSNARRPDKNTDTGRDPESPLG